MAWSDPGHDPDVAVIWGQAGKNSNGPHKSDIRNPNRGILASNAYFYGPSAPPSILHTAFIDAGLRFARLNIKWLLIGQDGQRHDTRRSTLCVSTLYFHLAVLLTFSHHSWQSWHSHQHLTLVTNWSLNVSAVHWGKSCWQNNLDFFRLFTSF